MLSLCIELEFFIEYEIILKFSDHLIQFGITICRVQKRSQDLSCPKLFMSEGIVVRDEKKLQSSHIQGNVKFCVKYENAIVLQR